MALGIHGIFRFFDPAIALQPAPRLQLCHLHLQVVAVQIAPDSIHKLTPQAASLRIAQSVATVGGVYDLLLKLGGLRLQQTIAPLALPECWQPLRLPREIGLALAGLGLAPLDARGYLRGHALDLHLHGNLQLVRNTTVEPAMTLLSNG